MKETFDTAIDIIWNAIEAAWDFLKKIWIKIVNFTKNIISWFKDATRIMEIMRLSTAFLMKKNLN